MSWASKRRLKYVLIVLAFLLAVAFAIFYPLIFKDPTCFDNKQNGEEGGVDCGGMCSVMCKDDIREPVVVWSRAFPVVGNIYNLVAFVENRNINAATETAPYEFKIYDSNNQLLGTRKGTTYIPPNQQFAIFEARFDAGPSRVKTVIFEFSPSITWVKKDPVLPTLPILVSNIVFDNDISTPNLAANISNESIHDLPEFEVVAILYDIEHNAINASKTTKNELLSSKSLSVYFTWPEFFTTLPVTKDILIQVNPFSLSF